MPAGSSSGTEEDSDQCLFLLVVSRQLWAFLMRSRDAESCIRLGGSQILVSEDEPSSRLASYRCARATLSARTTLLPIAVMLLKIVCQDHAKSTM